MTFLIDLGERCQQREQVLAARALARLMAGREKAEGAVADATAARGLVATRGNERLRRSERLLAAGRFGELQLGEIDPEEITHLPRGGSALEGDLRTAVAGLSQPGSNGDPLTSIPSSLSQAVILAALRDTQGAELAAAPEALEASPDSPHAALIRSRVRFFAGRLSRLP